MSIKISACCIIKNEEANLPIWLANMAKVADEIIVVDTGSEDSSRSIAQKAGAKVYFYDWINDFAAAKNFAIDKASGDWILFLDADEYFTDASLLCLRDVIKKFNAQPRLGAVLCRLTNIDKDNYNRVMDSMLQVRIFRNLPQIRYRGAIHEQLENSKGNMDMLFCKEIEILHTGYSSSINIFKARRNLELLKQKEKESSGYEKVKLYSFLMDAYNTVGEYEKSLEYGKKCLEEGIVQVGQEGHTQLIMLINMRQLHYSMEEMESFADEAMKAFPENPIFLLEMAFIKFDNGYYADALKLLGNAYGRISIIEKKLLNGEGITNTYKQLLPKAYSTEGKILYLKGDIEGAIQAFEKGIKEDAHYSDLLQGLYYCMGHEDDVVKIQIINSLYNPERDGAFIVAALGGIASSGVISYYAKKADMADKTIPYLKTGNYDSAAVELARSLERENMLAVACNIQRGHADDNVLSFILGSKYSRLMKKQVFENIIGKSLQERAIARLLNESK